MKYKSECQSDRKERLMNFNHIAFQVSDMDSSIIFYTQKLGFKFIVRHIDEEEQEEFALLKYGNADLELVKNLKNEYQKPIIIKPYCPHLAIKVDDMKPAFESLKENNIKNIVIAVAALEITESQRPVFSLCPFLKDVGLNYIRHFKNFILIFVFIDQVMGCLYIIISNPFDGDIVFCTEIGIV